MRLGVSIREDIGIGDKVQFSSLPENYFRATGEKLVDVSRAWIFDHNPFVDRERPADEVRELWNFPRLWEWPKPPHSKEVYTSNAQIWAAAFGVPVALNRPRLYAFEDFPFDERETIYLHTHGKSHGTMPAWIIEHVLRKYENCRLVHLGKEGDPDYDLPSVRPKTLWELAEALSKARMLIGVDSGPSWVAAAYPDVVIKKVRLRKVHGQVPLNEWVPLEWANHHSHWDDRAFQIFNDSEDDYSFTQSFRKI